MSAACQLTCSFYGFYTVNVLFSEIKSNIWSFFYKSSHPTIWSDQSENVSLYLFIVGNADWGCNGPASDVVHNTFIHFYMTWCFIFSILPPIRSVTVLLMYQLEKAVSYILQRVPIPLMSLWSVSALILSQTVDLLFPRWRAPFSFWSLKMSDWHARLPLRFP